MSQPKEESYYDVLKVDRKATIAEIVAAYHTAKNAFSRDSVATYSLFTPEEAQEELDKLEEAYLHLSNIDKKRAYDRALDERASSGGDLLAPEPMPEIDIKPMAQAFQKASSPASPRDTADSPSLRPSAPQPEPVADVPAQPATLDGPLTGGRLKEIRERRSLSIDDVARITKIPVKFVAALEAEDMKSLPARVYLQGFIKNLAALYKLEPKAAARSYLDHTDGKTQEGRQPRNV